MNTESLFRILSEMHPLTEEFKARVEKDLFLLSRPKNHFLLQEFQFSRQAYFMLKGFALSFFFRKGTRVISSFWNKDSIIVSPKSFFEQTPAVENIQLLEDSELLCISYESVQNILNEYPVIANFLSRAVVISHGHRNEKRIIEMVSLSAWERYRDLIKSYPDIEQKVSQEMIASYLGITPSSLSRMKKERKGL